MELKTQWVYTKKSAPAILLISILLLYGCHNHDSNATNAPADLNYLDGTNLINRGRPLFLNNCGVCHAIHKTDNHLAGIVDKIGVSYLKAFITKQDSLIQAKDEYAVEVKRIWGAADNAHNFQFSEEQLNAIIAYLKKYAQ